MKRRVLGLDLGTNSIGWASIIETENAGTCIEAAGSRILPTDASILGDFDKGNTVSQTKERTAFRSARRLRERSLLRRERLHRVLHILGFLPEHYEAQIDFDQHPGKFLENAEPKLAWIAEKNGRYTFLFKESFEEMLADFTQSHPSWPHKIPYDWTLYYLRKKALKQKINKEELAWILLNFNQKRGYYQFREEEKGKKDEQVDCLSLKIVRVEATEEKKGNNIWYNIYLENGLIYRRSSSIPLFLWEGTTKDFIVTTSLNSDGIPKTDKQGGVKRSIRLPKEDDWTLLKTKTENDLKKSCKTIGEYIYDALLQMPQQKIRGKLVSTIERKFYKEELIEILKKQTEFHPELQDRLLYERCINDLYPHNEAHRQSIEPHGFIHLFVNDILFYQRPLKSKKSLVGNCPYESHIGKDQKTKEPRQYGVKCIAKSHPLFQEFRIWHFLFGLRIYQKEKYIDGSLQTDVDVTQEFLPTEEDYVNLFDWLNDLGSVNQKTFFKYPSFRLKKKAAEFRWNYVEDKDYPCNKTRYEICSRLKKAGIELDWDQETETALWHLFHSITDKGELKRALATFARKHQLEENTFIEVLSKVPPFEEGYAAYSAKAIKKLLPLMRMGKYWSKETFDARTNERIEKLITGECDENISNRVREIFTGFQHVEQFKGLPVWKCCYAVYDRHSEGEEVMHWKTPEDIDAYLNQFRQHSLHNPIVEQVVLETLRVVRDVWRQIGKPDEIHIELGRNMKATAEQRKKQTAQILENEVANLRIKALLAEFAQPEYKIENVRPYSPSQQELLRIYEETILNDESEQLPDDILSFLKNIRDRKMPTHSEFLRYKCWLEQKYRSPYTGKPIPLAKLFTPAYEIEHIIPQKRFFDDSFSNKVICEASVNKRKGDRLGYEFIKECYGSIVETGFGQKVPILTVEAYEAFVKDHYDNPKSRAKMKKLLMEDIPDTFIERQLNDSRYISKLIKRLLSNIVREKDEMEDTSKNVIVCTGGVTDRLKRDWGLNDVWNDLVAPRFERLNKLEGTERFGHWVCMAGKRFFRTEVPLEFQKGFSKKRIDHRHHAMDAIVIACATRNIISYLNNESARKGARISRQDLRKLLCDKVNTDDKGNYSWIIRKPWETFTQDVLNVLENIVASFKQDLRIINKCTNVYTHYKDGKKQLAEQHRREHWAIRKSLHKATVYGRVNLRRIKEVGLSAALNVPSSIVDKEMKKKVMQLLAYKYDKKGIERYFKENASLWKRLNLSKIQVYYFTDDTSKPLVASRTPLDTSFDKKKIIEKVTDTGIQKILLAHLADNGGNPSTAFSPEGIEEMNRNLTTLNDGKPHQPIYRVRVTETLGRKFAVGEKGNRKSKFVEADQSTNLFFAVYADEEGKRQYETIPFNLAVERQEQGLKPVPEQNGDGHLLLFWLSPNDLVYVPTEEEAESGNIEVIDKSRIYKMVSCTESECHFIPANIANPIVQTKELGSNNKAQRAWTSEMIKEICLPLQVDRLGNVILIKP